MRPVLFAAVFVIAVGAAYLHAAPLTRLERQRLVAHLEMTGSWLVDEVSGLAPAQLQFRPAPGAWNIMEVVEHLAVAEPIYWRQLHEAMKTPPRARARPVSEAGILWYGIDRTQRQPAVAAEEPKRQLQDLGAGLDALHKLHREMLEYVRTTAEDLHSHIVEREGSDAYEWFLLISTHAQRHILQIREIKAHPRFPAPAKP
ncbi:MAG: DinB family protein [Acidobacteriota bacterium]